MGEKVIRCPVYMEDHTYGGNIARIESFTNINFGKMRTTVINGKPYFCCIDICRALGLDSDHAARDVRMKADTYTPYRDSIAVGYYELYYYIPTEVVTGTKKDGSPSVQTINMMYICEPIMYMVIFKSRKPEALEFQWWVYEDILPRISYLGRDNSIRVLQEEIMRLNRINEELSLKNHISSSLLKKVSSEFNNKCIDNSLMQKDMAIKDTHINDMHIFNNHLMDEVGVLSMSATNITEIQKTLFDIIRCLEGFAQVADRKI